MTEIVLSRRLPHPIERVWRACSEPAELAQWMPVNKDEPIVCEPPLVIAWDSNGHYVRIELARDGAGTRMTFIHRFDGDVSDPFEEGWERYLLRLEVVLAGGALSEEQAHVSFALEDGPQLHVVRRFACSVERLWSAIADEGDAWFPGDLEVLEADPPHRLVGRWHGDTLTFALAAEGPVVALTFTHAFAERDTAARSAAGWERCFARLDAALSGSELGEQESLKLWPYVHERYAETFGVDPEIGRRAYAEHHAT